MATIQQLFPDFDWENYALCPDVGDAIRAVEESSKSGGYRDRSSALMLWQRVACGNFDPDNLEFLQAVAKAIVGIESKDVPQRLKALGEATGLGGTLDRYRKARGLQRLWLNRAIEETGQPPSRAQLREALKRHPELWPKWDHEPNEADFDALLRSIETSYDRRTQSFDEGWYELAYPQESPQ